jgi:hypothetical protein
MTLRLVRHAPRCTPSSSQAPRRVRLIRKLADRLDGVDLSAYEAGDIITLRGSNAALLLAEGWAVPIHLADEWQKFDASGAVQGATCFHSGRNEHRRFEDAVREELRDSRAKTIRGSHAA